MAEGTSIIIAILVISTLSGCSATSKMSDKKVLIEPYLYASHLISPVGNTRTLENTKSSFILKADEIKDVKSNVNIKTNNHHISKRAHIKYHIVKPTTGMSILDAIYNKGYYPCKVTELKPCPKSKEIRNKIIHGQKKQNHIKLRYCE
jgi:hypothetical protein